MAGFPARSASFVITLLGIIVNSLATVHVLAAFRSLRWEQEFEWDNRGVDGVKVMWAVLFAYFASSAAICTLGFVGVVKSKPVLVRFYRDSQIGDFVFGVLATAGSAYMAWRKHTRVAVCEELSRQPELMHDLTEIGLSLENCERWFERAVMGFVACMIIVLVARLHCLLAVSRFYSHLSRHQRLPSAHGHSHSYSHSHAHRRSGSMQRIYLLPRNTSAPPTPTDEEATPLVYAPVPIHDLPAEVAQDLRRNAREAWVKKDEVARRQQQRYSEQETGRICLPVKHNEPLHLSHPPAYFNDAKI